VVLTRTSDTGVGPCVTERAALGNEVHANAAVSIHADGGPPGGRGFAILEPVADGINNAIVRPSAVLGADLRAAFAAGTGEPVSSYDGVNGNQPHDDLAGLNLSTAPKVFIECANMRNAADAALVTSARWQVRGPPARSPPPNHVRPSPPLAGPSAWTGTAAITALPVHVYMAAPHRARKIVDRKPCHDMGNDPQ
jgi:N-acetylmuramoyl-L-alanine amidase